MLWLQSNSVKDLKYYFVTTKMIPRIFQSTLLWRPVLDNRFELMHHLSEGLGENRSTATLIFNPLHVCLMYWFCRTVQAVWKTSVKRQQHWAIFFVLPVRKYVISVKGNGDIWKYCFKYTGFFLMPLHFKTEAYRGTNQLLKSLISNCL